MARTYTKLTRTAIRKLERGAQITENGIRCQRLDNGDGVYSINIMVDGERIHRAIGRESEGTTRTQAEQFIERVRRDAREGRLSLPRGRKLALSFQRAAERYVARLADLGDTDLVMKRRRLRLHLLPFFGDMPLARITEFDIERYKSTRLKAGAKQSTINRELAVLSHLFSKGIEWGWITSRPAKITRYREEDTRIVYLTVPQMNRLKQVAMQDQNPQVYPFIMIGLDTSMRYMEILRIRREHVDVPRRIIHIPEAKGGKRDQPITASLARFLADYMAILPDDTPWLFPSKTSTPGHAVNITKAFRRVVAAARLDPNEIVRHTMRHTAITHLVQANVDLPTVRRISGHKTLRMVARYAHQHGEHIRAAMDKLEKRYESGCE